MVRTTLIVITDDQTTVQKTQNFGFTVGAQVESFTPTQWAEKNRAANASVPALALGTQPLDSARVLQFPTMSLAGNSDNPNKTVQSINDLEAQAIENAISTFRGNLTEAARALGIGRATLYRKVKQYNIDPAQARKKKVA